MDDKEKVPYQKPKIKRAEAERKINEIVEGGLEIAKKYYEKGFNIDMEAAVRIVPRERQKLWEIFEKFFEIVD